MIAENKEPKIVPNIEAKLSKTKRDEVHEIVQEIKRFGISQRQTLYLIQQLALQLENLDIMREVITVLGKYRESVLCSDTDTNKLIGIHQQPKKLIME